MHPFEEEQGIEGNMELAENSLPTLHADMRNYANAVMRFSMAEFSVEWNRINTEGPVWKLLVLKLFSGSMTSGNPCFIDMLDAHFGAFP